MFPIDGLSYIASRYDAFLLDLWGVIHDGTRLYPGVHETLVRLRKEGKKIIFLSNAPRRAWRVEEVLNGLGVEAALYDAAVSSGEAGYHWLAQQNRWKKNYYYIGPSKDADILDGLDYRRADDLKNAGFLLNVGFGSEAQATDDWMPLLRAARGAGLPMLCLNPDLEVVKITGERFPCAGVIAQAYERLGGAVTWFGKPYPDVYEYCMQALGAVKKSRILAVGDSPMTDIAGAVNFGLDALLVTGGILKEHAPQSIAALCGSGPPRYVMQGLAW